MELIDPTYASGIQTSETWNVVKNICIKYKLNYVEVCQEIMEMRDNAEDLSQVD